MTTTPQSELPTTRQLLRATAAAIAAAALLLTTIVLPAEYGIDPVGVGRALGIARPPEPEAEIDVVESAAVVNASGSRPALQRRPVAFRTDETPLVLASGEGAELKAIMAAGQTMVYSWQAEGGGVDVDMHGEPANAQDGEAKSYWKDEGQLGDHGVFTAPLTGRHGWFWQNLNDTPVTIRLRTSGFYERIVKP